jgi:Ni,Fe-hydrogenase I large subunit
MKQRAFFQDYKMHRIEAASSQSKIQEKILQKIISRYEKDFFLVDNWDGEKKRLDGERSPSKMKQISVIDSPPYTGKKMKHGKSSEMLAQRQNSPRKPEIQKSKHLGDNIKHLLICQL